MTRPHPVFHGLDYGRMLLVNRHLAMLADSAEATLPLLLDRILADTAPPAPLAPAASEQQAVAA